MNNRDTHLLLWWVMGILFLVIHTLDFLGAKIDIEQVSLNFLVSALLLISIQLKDIYIELESKND